MTQAIPSRNSGGPAVSEFSERPANGRVQKQFRATLNQANEGAPIHIFQPQNEVHCGKKPSGLDRRRRAINAARADPWRPGETGTNLALLRCHRPTNHIAIIDCGRQPASNQCPASNLPTGSLARSRHPPNRFLGFPTGLLRNKPLTAARNGIPR